MNKVLVINRKNFDITVIKAKIKDLEINKFSHKFRTNNIDINSEVYLKCDTDGNLEYRGKRNEYRVYPILN